MRPTPRDLAEELGLRTADSIEPPAARRKRLSTIEREVDADLDVYAVAIIGHTKDVPRHFGDNEGARDSRVIMAKMKAPPTTGQEECEIADAIDRMQPRHPMTVLAVVYLSTKERATPFKLALESAWMGQTSKTRHAWRSFDANYDLSMLDVVFGVAAEDSGHEPFDLDGWLSRRKNAIAKKMRRAGGR